MIDPRHRPNSLCSHAGAPHCKKIDHHTLAAEDGKLKESHQYTYKLSQFHVVVFPPTFIILFFP